MTDKEIAKRVADVLSGQISKINSQICSLKAQIMEERQEQDTGILPKNRAITSSYKIQKVTQKPAERLEVYKHAHKKILAFLESGHAENGESDLMAVVDRMVENNRKQEQAYLEQAHTHRCENSQRCFSTAAWAQDMMDARLAYREAEKCHRKERHYAAVKNIVLEAAMWDVTKECIILSGIVSGRDAAEYSMSVLSEEGDRLAAYMADAVAEQQRIQPMLENPQITQSMWTRYQKKNLLLKKKIARLLSEVAVCVFAKTTMDMEQEARRMPSEILRSQVACLEKKIGHAAEVLNENEKLVHQPGITHMEHEHAARHVQEAVDDLIQFYTQAAAGYRLVYLAERAERLYNDVEWTEKREHTV